MNWLLLESCLLLIRVELLMKFRDLQAILRLVQRLPVSQTHTPASSIDVICHAIDLACVLYVKPVLCLQRSAAATVLLRRYGWRAELVIGAQLVPFKSHAWTEVEGRVVNDKPYLSEIYSVLERC